MADMSFNAAWQSSQTRRFFIILIGIPANTLEIMGRFTDLVIMKDLHTGVPRGFEFITYADPSAVDKVIEDDHVFNGKQIKRNIPEGAAQSKDFKTEIFVGGIPSTVSAGMPCI